jgi:hypothetical protein
MSIRICQRCGETSFLHLQDPNRVLILDRLDAAGGGNKISRNVGKYLGLPIDTVSCLYHSGFAFRYCKQLSQCYSVMRVNYPCCCGSVMPCISGTGN